MPKSLTLNTQAIRYIALFEGITGASVKDCIPGDDNILFIIKNGEMGKAIGLKGEKVKKVQTKIGKHVKIVQHTNKLEEFISNLLKPIEVKSVSVRKTATKKMVAEIELNNQKDLSVVIGRGGNNINRLTTIVSRHFELSKILVK